MRLRYTLNNATEGEHITTYSPKGWEEMELVLKRHDKYDGVFKDFTTKVDFFCGAGKEYVDNIYDTQGIEAEVTVLIEMDCDDSGAFDTLYEGKLIMKSYEKVQAAPEYTRVNLEQSGIIQIVLNRLETKINLNSTETLDGDAVEAFTLGPYELTMHSKAIVQQSEFLPIDASFTSTGYNNGSDVFFNLPMYPEIAELPISNTTSVNFISGAGSAEILVEAGQDYELIETEYRIKGSVKLNATVANAKYEIDEFTISRSFNGSSTTLFNTDSGGQFSGDYTINFDIPGTSSHSNVLEGAGFTFVFTLRTAPPDSPDVDPLDNFPFSITLTLDEDVTFCNFSAISTTDPTTANVFPVFEAGADIARKITGQNDSFRSNYYGRTNSEPFAYDENGCGSKRAITNGFQIRGFPVADKPITLSMKEYFEGLSAIDCLGLGIKEAGGYTYVEIEPKDYFYTDESVFSLSYIANLKSKVDPGLLYNRIRIGYSEWRKEGVNGLDEFCTAHNYSTKHKSISNEVNAISDFIAGPYAIERQRRLIYTDTATEDGEYDNNNFIICLNLSDMTMAEKDENFSNITNIFSPETIYNLRISPARNLRNWVKIIGTGLIKINSILKDIKFTFAEGNYKMTSQGTDSCDPAQQVLIGEGDDIELTIPNASTEYEPFFTGDVDEFETHFSKSQYDELKEVDENEKPNYYKKIRYSTTNEDFLAGYILELRYRPVKGTASFRMARAYERTEECTHIYVEEGYVECDYVE